MLDHREVQRIVEEASRKALPAKSHQRIDVEDEIGPSGDDAIRITIVVKAEAADTVEGAEVIEMLWQVRQRLLENGDVRFPLIGFATEEELLEDAQSGA